MSSLKKSQLSHNFNLLKIYKIKSSANIKSINKIKHSKLK